MTTVAGNTNKYFVKSLNKEMWFYCLTLGKDANGKRIQIKKRGFNSEREAKKALRDAQHEADKGTYIKPSKTSYGDYINGWFDTRKGTLGRLTAKNAEVNIKHHIVPLIGLINLIDLNVDDIEKWLSKLRDKKLAESTIKKIFSLVSSSLISATKKGTISKNVASFAENKPKVKRKQVEVWDEHEARQFLEYAYESKSRYYTALLLGIMTGMRQGEILGLRWMDIDYNRKLISVRQTLSHDGKDFGPPKTESSIRSITIDDDTIVALKRHKELIAEDELNSEGLYVKKDLVICTSVGTQCKPRDLDKRWNTIRDNAKMRRITFHDLRHTHASLLLKNNVHPKVVSERLGHSSIQITLDLYSHLFPNMQEDAAIGIGRMILATKETVTEEIVIEKAVTEEALI